MADPGICIHKVDVRSPTSEALGRVGGKGEGSVPSPSQNIFAKEKVQL